MGLSLSLTIGVGGRRSARVNRAAMGHSLHPRGLGDGNAHLVRLMLMRIKVKTRRVGNHSLPVLSREAGGGIPDID